MFSGAQKEKYKTPSYQIREGDSVNIDVTSPGATLALGMMYFNSGNRFVMIYLFKILSKIHTTFKTFSYIYVVEEFFSSHASLPHNNLARSGNEIYELKMIIEKLFMFRNVSLHCLDLYNVTRKHVGKVFSHILF